MARFLLDENLGRIVAQRLRDTDFVVVTAREAGLRAQPDELVYAHAKRERLAVISLDLDFSNIHRFPLGEHEGIVLGRFPTDFPPTALADRLIAVLRGLAGDDLRGNLVVVSPGALRIRRPRAR